MQHAGSVEAIGVGRDTAHGVHADGTADRLVMAAAQPVGPWNVELDRFFEGSMRQLGGDALDGGGGDAGLLCHALGRVFVAEKPLGEELEYGHRLTPIRQAEGTRQRRRDVGGNCIGEFTSGSQGALV
jgi:hypothetical protein